MKFISVKRSKLRGFGNVHFEKTKIKQNLYVKGYAIVNHFECVACRKLKETEVHRMKDVPEILVEEGSTILRTDPDRTVNPHFCDDTLVKAVNYE
uniref:Uncharacterized protein n=1 Tax=Acrobeloides nanus TaxID=290746 RepID=A0A914D0V0_9BILA